MKYGKFLPENGTIGFVAPSFGCNIELHLRTHRKYGQKRGIL